MVPPPSTPAAVLGGAAARGPPPPTPNQLRAARRMLQKPHGGRALRIYDELDPNSISPTVKGFILEILAMEEGQAKPIMVSEAHNLSHSFADTATNILERPYVLAWLKLMQELPWTYKLIFPSRKHRVSQAFQTAGEDDVQDVMLSRILLGYWRRVEDTDPESALANDPPAGLLSEEYALDDEAHTPVPVPAPAEPAPKPTPEPTLEPTPQEEQAAACPFEPMEVPGASDSEPEFAPLSETDNEDAGPSSKTLASTPKRDAKRKAAAAALKHQGQKMKRQAAKKQKCGVEDLPVGTIVAMRLEDVDRAGADNPNATCVVVEATGKGSYRIANRAGVYKECVARVYLTPHSHANVKSMNLVDVLEGWKGLPQVGIRKIAAADSVASGGQGMLRCACLGKCDMKKCACFKAGRRCNSRCHPKNNKCTNHD